VSRCSVNRTSFWRGDDAGGGIPFSCFELAAFAALFTVVPVVKISPSRLASSRHLVSVPLWRTASASDSRRFNVRISSLSSAMERAAVAWSRISSSAASTSLSGASSRSSTSSASRAGVPGARTGAAWPPRWSTSSSRSLLSSRSRRRRRDWKIASGEEASRRCRMVSANPTVPARLSFSSASARLNSSRTYSVTDL